MSAGEGRDEPAPPATDAARAVALAASVSLGVGALVLTSKLLAWRVTGSVALYSDALESIVNVVAAGTMLWAVRVARRPADDDHPFGHGKAEYLSAVVEGALVLVAALATLRAAAPALLRPRPLEALGLGAALSAFASVLNAALAWFLTRQGRRYGSLALEADGAHVWSDVLTSAGVLVGVGLARLTGLLWLDALLAIVVAAHIAWVGVKLVRRSVGGLMDELLDPSQAASLRASATAAAQRGGGLAVRRVRLRQAGPYASADLELVVPGAMSVREAHALCDAVEAAVREALPGTECVVHVVPDPRAP